MFISDKLYEELNSFQNIIIYGTGEFARIVYPKLVNYGLKEKISCFTQTRKADIADIDGIPVADFSSLKFDSQQCAVLVAVSERYSHEIKQNLIQHGYLNCYYLTDFQISLLQYNQQLENKLASCDTIEDYCMHIANWYVESREKGAKQEVIMRELINKASRQIDDNLVVVITGHLSPRLVKIAGALKRKNLEVVLLFCKQAANPWCLNELNMENIFMHECRCIEEMLYFSLQYSPLVYFFEPHWGNCLWAKIMLINKKFFGKIIISLYDVINDGISGMDKSNLDTEKYALEHADGIVWRWFSKQYLESKGFVYQGKSIQFLDYCNHHSEKSESIFKDNSFEGKIKLCSISADGNVYVDNRNYSEEYTDWARINEILEIIGNNHKCIFHYYAGKLSEQNLNRCKQFEKKYKNFRFYLAVDHNELLKRLETYDYGCDFYTGGKEPPDEMLVGGYYGSYFNNSVRNAFFDFISAGLPVITTQASKMWHYLQDYDLVIKMDLTNLDLGKLERDRKYYKKQVQKAKNELDIDNQIPKLIQFFKEV